MGLEDVRTCAAPRSGCFSVTHTIHFTVFEIRRYRTASGVGPVTDWLEDLPDRQARARILARLERLEIGNFGDCKFLRDGVSELRVDWGPGYRVYFGREGKAVVILLCGGAKQSQVADIKQAKANWKDYETRKKPGGRRSAG